MRAVIAQQSDRSLRVDTVPTPGPPRSGEALVRIQAHMT
jgi:hypothetical protein